MGNFEDELTQKAYQIAKDAHAGQKDKAGLDYISHPLAVCEKITKAGYGPEYQAAALLHDVVEDTPVDLDDLRRSGIPETVVDAVDCLTKREGLSLPDYLARVKANEIARAVKLADISHNSDITRIPNPAEKDYRRVERYHREAEYLKSDSEDRFTE